jgi:4-hydroxy-tetrahydrodipicolinate synthase
MLYNIPGNAVNALTPALVTRLADLDTVVAVKESSGDWNNYYATAIAVQDRLRVFCGPSSVFGVPAVLAGADGTVDCFPNMWAPGGLDLFHAPRAGRIEEANRLQELGVKLTTLFTTGGRTLYPATKAAMELLGLPGGKLRPPLRPLGAEALAGLKQGLVELGLLEGAPAHRKSASFAR